MSTRRMRHCLLTVLCVAMAARAASAGERPRLADWLPPGAELYVEMPVDGPVVPLPAEICPAWLQQLLARGARVEAFAWDEERRAAVCLVRNAAIAFDGPWSKVVDDRLLVSTGGGLLDEIDKRRADLTLATLTHDARFARAWSELPGDQPWRMYVSMERTSQGAARAWRLATRLLGSLVELSAQDRLIAEGALTLLGASLERGDYLAMSARLDARPPRLTAVVPREAHELGLALRLFASLAEPRPTLAPLLPNGTILSLSTSIDRELMADAAHALLDRRRLAPLVEERPEIGPLLEGLFFGLDALDQIESRVQIVVARQNFAAEGPRPEFPLPAVAVAFEPREPARLKPAMVLGFVGAVREANEAAARQGRPRYVMNNQRFGEALVTSGVMSRRGQPSADRLEYNLSPAIGFVGKRFIVSTSEELAVGLVRAANEQVRPRQTAQRVRVDVGPFAGMRLAMEELSGLTRRATRERWTNLPLVRGAGAMIGDGCDAAGRLLGRLPQPTIRAPLPDLTGRYQLRVIAVD